jgi:ketosteroid isomerase-like protein
MKPFAVAALVVLGICTVAMAQKKDVAKELIAAEEDFSDALVREDWKAVEEVYADDLVFTSTDGSVTHKTEEVASVRSGDLKLESIKMADLNVQDLGHVAVVTGKIVEKGRYKTADVSGTYCFTDVWVKRNGRWQLVTGHETLVTPAK